MHREENWTGYSHPQELMNIQEGKHVYRIGVLSLICHVAPRNVWLRISVDTSRTFQKRSFVRWIKDRKKDENLGIRWETKRSTLLRDSCPSVVIGMASQWDGSVGKVLVAKSITWVQTMVERESQFPQALCWSSHSGRGICTQIQIWEPICMDTA